MAGREAGLQVCDKGVRVDQLLANGESTLVKSERARWITLSCLHMADAVETPGKVALQMRDCGVGGGELRLAGGGPAVGRERSIQVTGRELHAGDGAVRVHICALVFGGGGVRLSQFLTDVESLAERTDAPAESPVCASTRLMTSRVQARSCWNMATVGFDSASFD